MKLSNLQLNKLKSATKIAIQANLWLSKVWSVTNEPNFMHNILLTGREVSGLCKAFANNSLANVKLSQTLLVSLLIYIALTNKVINKVTGALVTISIGRTVIIIWNYISKFQHRDLLPLYTEERHPAQVLVSIIVPCGLDWIGQSEAVLLKVSTLLILSLVAGEKKSTSGQ